MRINAQTLQISVHNSITTVNIAYQRALVLDSILNSTWQLALVRARFPTLGHTLLLRKRIQAGTLWYRSQGI